MANYLNPLLGVLPGSVSFAMLLGLLRALPGPLVGQAAAYGRELLLDALALVDAAGPRDRLEAMLLMQVPPLLVSARETQALALRETDWDRRAKLERHAMALQRRAEALQREIRRHRRDLKADGLEHVASPGNEVDMAKLEAAWRDPAVVLGEDVLVPRAVDPASFWPVQVAPPPAGDAADAGLEARDEFEVDPAPVFQGVPLWQQHGRKWLDQLTDEELREIVEAGKRGEEIAEPPQRPEGVAYPKKEQWRKEGNWISPEALAAR